MNHQRNTKRSKPPRIGLTDQDLKRLSDIRGTLSAAVLAKHVELPYMLVYNIVQGRVKSVSDRHYRMLFGEVPPCREPKQVDGTAFRAMVELWLFLDTGVSRSDLYREFYSQESLQKIDYRIFNGRTRKVDVRLARFMREKFLDAGIDEQLLERWLAERELLPRDNWVSYDRIRPVLLFLRDELGLHPTSVLKQSVNRYETGMLKRVSREIYDGAMILKRRAEKVLVTGQNREIDQLKEAITGEKPGYTRFSAVEEELHFLKKYARKSAKSYLGRGLWTYTTGRAKRITDPRARKIRHDCDKFIRQRPELPLSCLPRSRQGAWIRMLLDVLVARTARLLSEQEGIVFEKRILRPSHAWHEYKNPYHGFTRFDMASSVLGMKRRAFDLMVAENCEIFRSVGRYAKRWYLSDLYLEELSGKAFFSLISAKYELMAKKHSRLRTIDRCRY